MSAKNNIIKIKSIGTYDFINKQVDLTNNVKIKTKNFHLYLTLLFSLRGSG